MGAVIGIKQAFPEQFRVQSQQPVVALSTPWSAQEVSPERISIALAEFVERRFIPEYAMQRRAAGRAHIIAILKHILTPERVNSVSRVDGPRHAVTTSLTCIVGWPYMDEVPLSEITPEAVRELLAAALNRGYSPQTVNHIRNTIGLIFSHAILCGEHCGINPVAGVPPLAIVAKQAITLTLTELKRAMDLMRYPERHIALMALLTDMSVAEICALRWKHVNLSNEYQVLGREQLPPRTIDVTMRVHRGDYCPVKGRRNRLVPLLDPLYSVLQELAFRPDFRGGEDFVLVSRTGSPVNPDNIVRRRLKVIGRNLNLPLISWRVFQRTGIKLRKQYDKQAFREIERVISVRH